ncbi:hypothetical protein D3C72_2500010 [compost metagenome]
MAGVCDAKGEAITVRIMVDESLGLLASGIHSCDKAVGLLNGAEVQRIGLHHASGTNG